MSVSNYFEQKYNEYAEWWEESFYDYTYEDFKENWQNKLHYSSCAISHLVKSIFANSFEFGIDTVQKTLFTGIPIGLVGGGILGGLYGLSSGSLYGVCLNIFLGSAFGIAGTIAFSGAAGFVGGALIGSTIGFYKGCKDIYHNEYDSD